MAANILVFDVGTTGLKTALFDADFSLIGSEFQTYETIWPHSGWAEQRPSDWWDALKSTTLKLGQAHSKHMDAVTGIAITGQMMGSIPLDKNGNCLTETVAVWSDARGRKLFNALIEKLGGYSELYGITQQGMQAELYSLSKIMWQKENQPHTFENTAHFVNASDYLALKLCGILATNPSELACVNAYDVRDNKFSDKILSTAGVDQTLFPKSIEPGTLLGKLRPEIANELGLPATAAVYEGMGDAVAACLGAMATKPGDGYFSFGTAMWGGIVSNNPVGDLASRVNVLPLWGEDLYQLQSVMNTGMIAHRWIVETMYNEANFSLADQEALDIDASTGGLFFFPNLIGGGAPFNNPNARGAFIGASPRHSRANFVRAVLEGLALNVKVVEEKLSRLSATKVEQIYVIGGGTQSKAFMSCLANILQKPIIISPLEKDATALGAAMCVGLGAGLISHPSDVMKEKVGTKVYEPDLKKADESSARAEIFNSIYGHIEPIFDQLNDFRSEFITNGS